MKKLYPPELVPSPLEVLRKAGYSPFTDPKTGHESFVVRLTSGYYPRFHLYLEQEQGQHVFSLHLDQKKASYKGTAMHAGEYDGPKVEKEMARIDGWVKALARGETQAAPERSRSDESPQPEPSAPSTKQNNPFGGIFG